MNVFPPAMRSGEIYREEIARLRGKIELLEEENRQLREAFLPSLAFPASWRLGPSLTSILASLYRAADGYRSKRQLYVALCGLSSETSEKIVAVQVCHLRARLRDLGVPITIDTVWGQGFRLTVESRGFITETLAGFRVAA